MISHPAIAPEKDPTLLTQTLENQIDQIALEISDRWSSIESQGLLGGKAGITLLFGYLSKVFPERNYSDITFEYLENLAGILENETLPYSMSAGVAGIGFIFQHLKNIGVLHEEDAFDLSEIDQLIDRGVEIDFQSGNWDPLHGMVGLGIYFLERNKETNDVIYLEKIIDYLSAMRVTLGEYQLWITPGYQKFSNDNYNFGMAHGMPGILSFLAQVYVRGIRQESIRKMIESCLPFILDHEFTGDPVYCFPTGIDVNPSGEKKSNESRLGWCYGDLCMANMLILCGKALDNEDWLTKGINVALKTTQRTFENAGCQDAPFCHGTTGLVHQYMRLFHLTNDFVFRAAADKWLDLTLDHFYKPGEGAGGYHFRTFKEAENIYEMVANYSLLEGSAGIALVYLSYIYDLKPEWDQIFLANV